MAVNVKYDKPKKLANIQSIFVSFRYKQSIVDAIRKLPERYWDGKNKVWELSYESLSELKKLLPKEEFIIEGNPINNKKFGEKLIEKQYTLPKELKTKLYEYQYKGFNELMNFDKYLLLDSQGLGKSIQAIAVAIKRKELRQVNHCLIICCVNGLKYNWQEEIKTHAGMDSLILGNRKNKKGVWSTGSTQNKLEDLENLKEFFIITNVESLRNKEIKEKLKKYMDKGIIDMIICDECHKTKNPSSIQGKTLLLLSKHVKYFYGLTGTVLKNSPLDAYVPLKCVGNERANFSQFKSRYCEFGNWGNYSIINFKNLGELQNKLDSVSLRRTKEDVLDLPPKTYINDYVEMGIKQRKLYNDVLKAIVDDIDNVTLSLDPLSQMIRLRQVTADSSIISSCINESAKFDRLGDIIEEVVSNNNKLVVFSNWVGVINKAVSRFMDYNPAIVTGEIKNRESQIKKFKNDESCKIIFGTLGALGTGYTLTEASTCVFLDEPYTFADKEQGADRIYRIGTNKNVSIITLICKGTIDEWINRIVNRKKVLGDTMIDHKFDIHNKEVIHYILTGEGDIIA